MFRGLMLISFHAFHLSTNLLIVHNYVEVVHIPIPIYDVLRR